MKTLIDTSSDNGFKVVIPDTSSLFNAIKRGATIFKASAILDGTSKRVRALFIVEGTKYVFCGKVLYKEIVSIIDETLADAISDETGFCVKSVSYEVAKDGNL